MNVLYLSYDGMLEPLGQSQVVNYLTGLAAHHAITLMSYEKRSDMGDRARMGRMAAHLESRGIRWVPLRYHKRPSLLATAWDVLIGIGRGWAICRWDSIGLLHARGYVAGVIALCLARLCKVRFVFDMRGFWPEEKIDAGHWTRNDLAYRLAKWWEQRLLEQAGGLVVLTQTAVQVLRASKESLARPERVEVIPTCVDLSHFHPGPKDPVLLDRLGLRNRVVIGCVGTLSNWYLREATLRYLGRLVKYLNDARILFVTREEPRRLQYAAVSAGIPEDRLVLLHAEFRQMPAYFRLMDVGVYFIRATFSKRASAPTRLGEFLATGVPVVINDGIGDSGALVRDHRIGIVLSDMTEASCQASLAGLEELLADQDCARRCRLAAEQHLSLAMGIQRYLRLYQRLEVGSPLTSPHSSAGEPAPAGTHDTSVAPAVALMPAGAREP